MTDTPTPDPGEDDAALAGEYVLGVLDIEGRLSAERRMRGDAAFAAQVAAWERHLSGLNDAYPEVPAPAVLAAIEARLFGRPAAPPRRGLAAWWARFVIGGALAGGLALLFLAVVPPPPSGLVLAATLAAEDQALAFAATWDGAAQELVVTRTAGAAAEAGRVHELWLIAGDGVPVPLGLIAGDALRAPLAALPEGAVLAVSLEPAGGSATGAPTGPVLVTGVVTRL